MFLKPVCSHTGFKNMFSRLEKLVDSDFVQLFNLGRKWKYHWDLPVFKEFIGRKLYEEIQSEIDRANEIVPNRFKFESGASFWPGLQRKIVVLQDLQDYLYLQKQADDRPPNYICLGCGTDCYHDLIQTTQKDIQDLQREILLWIEIEFNTVCWITADLKVWIWITTKN